MCSDSYLLGYSRMTIVCNMIAIIYHITTLVIPRPTFSSWYFFVTHVRTTKTVVIRNIFNMIWFAQTTVITCVVGVSSTSMRPTIMDPWSRLFFVCDLVAFEVIDLLLQTGKVIQCLMELCCEVCICVSKCPIGSC